MREPALTTALERRGALVLDGGLATELERHGADLSGGLWSARVLIDRPDLVASVHRDYLEAGADVITTASYQASVAGFAALGVSAALAESLIGSSVGLATTARDAFWADRAGRKDGPRYRPLVATSVGPYGAVLADGSEYRGDYGVPRAELMRFHRDRLEVLAAAGVEVLACETIPSLIEAEALVEVMSYWPDVTAWVSFSARDGRRVSDGTAIARCAAFLDGCDQVLAVGVNCTPPENVSELVRELTGATGKPVAVYPNSGEGWDPVRRRWSGGAGDGSAADFGTLSTRWYAAGARLIGGCCRTGPADIRAVAAALPREPPTTAIGPSAPN